MSVNLFDNFPATAPTGFNAPAAKFPYPFATLFTAPPPAFAIATCPPMSPTASFPVFFPPVSPNIFQNIGSTFSIKPRNMKLITIPTSDTSVNFSIVVMNIVYIRACIDCISIV